MRDYVKRAEIHEELAAAYRTIDKAGKSLAEFIKVLESAEKDHA